MGISKVRILGDSQQSDGQKQRQLSGYHRVEACLVICSGVLIQEMTDKWLGSSSVSLAPHIVVFQFGGNKA